MPLVSESTQKRVSAARRLAYGHLAERVKRYPDLFPSQLDVTGLNDRDARLAMAIDRAVTLRWLTLQAVIEPMLSMPWNKQHHVVKTALLAGAAQLLLLDRIPDHAAIDESVEWCRGTPAERAKGVVNAVLRRIVRLRCERIEKADLSEVDQIIRTDGSGWSLTEPVFAGDIADRVSKQTGCGRPLYDRIAALHGQDEATRIALHSMADPPIILHHADACDALAPHEQPGFHILRPGESLRGVLADCPSAIVQDPTAAAAVRATESMVPDCIVDFCAGRGTKTRQLAAMHPDARLIASDKSKLHLRTLQELKPLGVEVLTQADLTALAGQVDLLVLDVPCTNSGVLARRIEARHRQTSEFRLQLRDVQRQIAADALALLSPRGTLLWTTCSIDPDENESQVEWLTKWHDLEVEIMCAERGQGLPGENPEVWRDGGFFAKLRRRQVQPG
ncbi:MAG: hypothetical protein MK100_04355 [Phycisphaerales bacterium]|nr:hypothetical protein [Phycisphaerales bacterium]